MTQTPKVLVFTIRELSWLRDPSKVHGSVLWTENFLKCISRVPEIDVVVVSSVPMKDGLANQEFVKALGLDHSFVPSRSANIRQLDVWQILMDKYYFLTERYARSQKHVDVAVKEIIKEQRPDLIVLNEIHAALYVPSVFSLATPRCLVSVNNEVHFHRTYKSQGGPTGERVQHKLKRWLYRHGNWLSNRRFRKYMSRIYRQCIGIVALTPNDLPTDLPDSTVRAVIPPIYSKSDLQWGYRASRCVFFVGNIWIYSNRLAMEWISNRFAPELSKIDGTVRINIIGARTDQVPSSWPRLNTNFMGYADKEEVTRQMTTTDLFIAPIANPFGAKLKLAECVSHATPFLATAAAMSGVPFRTSMPQIDLDEPAAAARLAVDYINRPDSLTKLSQSISTQAQQARERQIAAWREFFDRCLDMAKGHGCTRD